MSSLLLWRHCQSRETTGLCRVGEYFCAAPTRGTAHPGPDAAYPGTRHYRAERALRDVVLGRKTWLFAGSDEGGRWAAMLYSLITTCKAHHVEPFAYLRDVFAKLPTWPQERLIELAPHRWAAAQAATTAAAVVTA